MVHQLTWGEIEEPIHLGDEGDDEFDLEHTEFEMLVDG